MSQRFLQIGNWIVFAGVVTVNVLANALPIAGRSTGEVSDLYPNLFTPAGITFSIWGIIYLGLFWFCIQQSKGLIGKGKAPDYVWSIGPWFMINGLANMGWILAWHHLLLIPSLLLMIVILSSLIIIYQRLDGYSWTYFRGVKIPFSIYFAWICVATLANTTVVLSHYGYEGIPLTPPIWTAVLIALAAATGSYVIQKFKDTYFMAVVVWALLGIIIKLELSFGWGFLPVVVALGSIAFLIVWAMVRLLNDLKPKRQTHT